MAGNRLHDPADWPGRGPAVAALLGGGFWLLAWWSGLARSPAAGAGAAAFLPLPLLLAVLLAFLYRRYARGRLERLGLLAAFAGAVVLVLLVVLIAFGIPVGAAAGSAGGIDLVAGWLWFLAPPVVFGGWLLFALAALRDRPLPRWNALPLLLGAVPLLMSLWSDLLEAPAWGLHVGAAAIGVGWLLLGYALWPPPRGLEPAPGAG